MRHLHAHEVAAAVRKFCIGAADSTCGIATQQEDGCKFWLFKSYVGTKAGGPERDRQRGQPTVEGAGTTTTPQSADGSTVAATALCRHAMLVIHMWEVSGIRYVRTK